MSVTIPADYQDLLTGPIFVSLATVMPNGQPQVNVMWCGFDGEHVLINTAKGRQKERNMAARPMATVLAVDPENAFRWLEIRGTVVEITEEGAVEHITSLAHTYAGQDYYGGVQTAEQAEKETRVICKIEPTRVIAFPNG